jgi:hypothetical protein
MCVETGVENCVEAVPDQTASAGGGACAYRMSCCPAPIETIDPIMAIATVNKPEPIDMPIAPAGHP